MRHACVPFCLYSVMSMIHRLCFPLSMFCRVSDAPCLCLILSMFCRVCDPQCLCSTLSMFCRVFDPSHDRLVGLVVKASTSRAEDPGFESRLWRNFSGSSHTIDLKFGAPVATLPGVIGSVLGLVGPVSVYCDWVRLKVWSAALSQCGSTSNCLRRSALEIHKHVVGTLSSQQRIDPLGLFSTLSMFCHVCVSPYLCFVVSAMHRVSASSCLYHVYDPKCAYSWVFLP